MTSSPVLIAIGGAVDITAPGAVLRYFYARCRQAAGVESIAILNTASARPEAGEEYVDALRRLGWTGLLTILDIHQRAQAHDPEYLRIASQACGFFFCGGNQVRLSAILGGTPLENALLSAYQRGAVVAGTSAGAAILSTHMLAYGKEGPTPRQGMAQFVPGLGFTDRVIFDQHFRQRDRLGRLIYAVTNNPRLLGVGVDENTAAVIEGDRLSVIGQNAVTLVNGSGLQINPVAEIAAGHPIAAGPLQVYVLTHGFSYNLATQSLVNIPIVSPQ